jgi:hypothetical protein
MSKRIVATILTYSLVQMVGIILAVLINELSLFVVPKYSILSSFIGFFALIITAGIGFVLLGYHLNNKYSEAVTYWKYLLVGAVISFIAVNIIWIGAAFFYNTVEESFSTYYYTFFLIGFNIVICSIIATYRKRLVSKND